MLAGENRDTASASAPQQFLFTPGKFKKLFTRMKPLDNELSLLNLALADASRVVYKWNLKEHTFTWSDNVTSVLPFAGKTGFESESDLFASIHEDDRQKFLRMRAELQSVPASFEWEYRLNSREGKTYNVRHIGKPSDTGNVEYIIGMIDAKPVCSTAAIVSAAAEGVEIVTEVKSSRASLYPENFVNQLQAALTACRQDQTSGGLMIVSINNLAMIMSAYGHDISEVVMDNIRDKIRHVLTPQDYIERIHRDQFGVIIAQCTNSDIPTIANKIYTIVQSYGSTATVGSVHVVCSIGSVDFPKNATNSIEALDKAYIAQNASGGLAFRPYEENREESANCKQQLGLANYLSKAIQTNRLRLAFQPIIESKTGKIFHYEALLRLISEDGKISSAGALIPIAERMGLIDIIDHLVLDMVAKELAESPNLHLSFNVSNLTTENLDWLHHLSNVIKEHPQIASRMMVEITETAAQRDLRKAAYFVASIQELGCQVALDDFGSGYTSFRQLKALSVDMIKIDGAFIKDLVDNADNRFFVKTLLDFTNGFGLKAVAEFVENGETAKMLMDLGVEYMQGYYFGRPENYRSWLNSGEYQKE